MKRVHLLISGRVQGVWYRASTQQVGARLGLVGWVRNLPSGQVEVVAEGPAADVEALVRWCGEGPPHARVEAVDARWSDATGTLEGFEVRYSARR